MLKVFTWYEEGVSYYSIATECEQLKEFLTKLNEEFPSLLIFRKKSILWCRILDVILKVLTLGKYTYFLSDLTMTFKNKIYLSETLHRYLEVNNTKCHLKALCTLRHEAVHLRQIVQMGLAKFIWCYVYPPFIKTRRATLIELPAYKETIRAFYEYFGKEWVSDFFIDSIVSIFKGPKYLWMYTDGKFIKNELTIVREDLRVTQIVSSLNKP